jgi:hypothetical protein
MIIIEHQPTMSEASARQGGGVNSRLRLSGGTISRI